MDRKELHIDINKAMSICIRNGYKVYPVPVGRLFKISVDKPNGDVKEYEDLVNGKVVASAVRKTYIAYSKLIIKQKENANSSKT